MKMTSEEIIKVLDNLVGPTEPYGDSAVDLSRKENLKTLVDIADWCLDRLYIAATYAESNYDSQKVNGLIAKGVLEDIAKWIQKNYFSL